MCNLISGNHASNLILVQVTEQKEQAKGVSLLPALFAQLLFTALLP